MVHFKIKKNTPLKKLMSAYCERQGLQKSAIRFVFDGNRINENNTPLEVSEACSNRLLWDDVIMTSLLKGMGVNTCTIMLKCVEYVGWFSFHPQLEMEDDDTIEVFQEQTGGGN